MGEHNLARLAEQAQERHGEHDTLWFEGGWYRNAQLFDRSRRLASGLRDIGVAPGDRVSVLMANCPEVGIAYHAIWRAGAVSNPIVFLLPPDEIRHILVDAGVRAIVTTPEFLANVLAACEPLDDPPAVVVAGGPAPVGGWSLEELESHEPGAIEPRRDDDLASLLYTGGTTGRAKGVALTHRNLAYCGEMTEQHTRLEEEQTRILLPLPLSHAYGQIVTVMGLHTPHPGRTALMRWFDPAASLALIEQHGLNRAAVVPSMLQLWLGQPLEERDLSTLRYVSSGASPLAREVAEEFMRRVPSARILEGYGCTESGGVISANRPGEARLGSVGRPLPGYEVRIRDEEGRDVATGETGEIVVRSPGCSAGYWRAPDATAATMRGGWLHTGDVGRLDEDGYLYVVDRLKDLIIRNGFNVFPRDVEDALLEHPGVAMAGVVGRPDATVGEEVVAFVSPAPGAELDPDDVRAFVRARLGGYTYPREVHVVDQVPLTPVMKTDRKALRRLLEEVTPTV